MSKVTAAAGVALTLMLAGCGETTVDQNNTQIEVSEGDYQQRLQALSDVERNGVFFRAIRDAGRDCRDIEGSTAGGELQGRPTWTARCTDGVDWLIIVGKDGLVQVVSREEAVQMGLPGVQEGGNATSGAGNDPSSNSMPAGNQTK